MRFTRLTVVGSARRGDVVLPSDEEVAVLLTPLLDLVEEPTGAGDLTLVRTTGEELDPSATLAAQGVLDGEIVRVTRTDEAPPPAETADVTETATDVLAQTAGHWDDRARRTTGSVGVAALVGVAGALCATRYPGVPVVAGLGVLVALALVVAATARGFAAVVAGAAAAALGIGLGLGLAGTTPAGVGAALAAPLVVGWLALGITAPRDRGRLTGAATGLSLTVLAAVLLASGASLDVTAAVVVTVAVVLLGILPWLALSAAGVHLLDDAALEGQAPENVRVTSSLVSAYGALTWSTVALALAIAVGAPVLVATPSAAARTLAVASVLVTALRSRPMPLTRQVVPLWSAVVVACAVGAVLAWPGLPGVAMAVLAALAVAGVVATTVRPNAQQRARLRRAGDTIEALAVLTLVPALIGVLGVYDLMLEVF